MFNPPALGCVVAVFLCATAAAQAAERAATLPARRILIDSIHAHNYLEAATPRTQYDYHWAYGYRRAFEFLRHRGMKVEEVRDGRLDARRLEGVSMLFINLVSADRPPFYVSEINAVRAYLEAGGSLLLITDHTNCYFHNHKLAPLLEELGVEGSNDMACEQGVSALGSGPGWIAVTRFTDHPVTRGLRAVALHAAGTVDSRFAIATTSELAWADLWKCPPYGQATEQGFYGNGVRDAGERSGPLGVVLGKTIGKGRLVIVADQNCFGDPSLNYADNYKLFLNAAAWLTGEAGLADASAYESWRGPKVLCHDDYASATFGNSEAGGYYRAFAIMGGRFAVFGCDDLARGGDVLVFAKGEALPQASLDVLVKHLKGGKAAVLLAPGPDDVQRRRGLAGQLITALGQPQLDAGRDHVTLTWPDTGSLLLYADRDGLANHRLASPSETPDAQQHARARRLLGVIEAALPRPREGR